MKDLIKNLAVKRIGMFLTKIICLVQLIMMSYYRDKNEFDLIKNTIKESKHTIYKPMELFMLYSLAKYNQQVVGDYVEVGVFEGMSAKIICEAKANKNLFLFDTFEGLPKTSIKDKYFRQGQLKSNEDFVKFRLKKYKNVHVYKGIFPKDTGKYMSDRKFSFVHLDVDIYQSTKDSLNFFYDKMNVGGIIISHDFHMKGVRKAFEEFFDKKPEKILKLPQTQCLIIKK